MDDTFLGVWDNDTLKKIVRRVIFIFFAFTFILAADMLLRVGVVDECIDLHDDIRVHYSLQYTGWFHVIYTKVKIQDMTFSNWYIADRIQSLDCKRIPECVVDGRCDVHTHFSWSPDPVPATMSLSDAMEECHTMYTGIPGEFEWNKRQTCANFRSWLKDVMKTTDVDENAYYDVANTIDQIWRKGESKNKTNKAIMLLFYKCVTQVLYVFHPTILAIMLGITFNKCLLKPLWEKEHIN